MLEAQRPHQSVGSVEDFQVGHFVQFGFPFTQLTHTWPFTDIFLFLLTYVQKHFPSTLGRSQLVLRKQHGDSITQTHNSNPSLLCSIGQVTYPFCFSSFNAPGGQQIVYEKLLARRKCSKVRAITIFNLVFISFSGNLESTLYLPNMIFNCPQLFNSR